MRVKPHTVDIGDSRRFEVSELPSFISRQVSEARRYYFDLNQRTQSSLYVALGGCERVRADYAIHRPTFSYFSIEFVAEGKGRILLDGREFELSPGSVFGYGPGSPLEISTSSSQLMTKYYVTFLGRSAQSILKTAGLAPNGFKHVHARHEVRDIYEMMISNGLVHSRYSQAICSSLIPTLAHKIAEQEVPADNLSHRAFETYLRVRDLLDQEFVKFVNVEQAAAQCGLTVPYICQLFKRFNHVTPYKYLLSQRMRYAADLLSNPGVLVKQVARRLDFADQFQFSRAFKRVFGISPAQFQRQLVPADKRT
jgi:AraC-like DNA-binding protein